MAGDHVGPESDGQRERPHHEGRHQFDGGHDQVQGHGHARGKQRVFQVAAKTLGLDAHKVVDDPHHQRQGDRDRHTAVGRELNARDDLKDVREEDEEEHRGQEGHELLALLADGLHYHRLLDKGHARLGNVLHTGRHKITVSATSHILRRAGTPRPKGRGG